MSIKFEAKLDAEIMTEFMLYHIYASRAGLCALLIGALNIGFAMVFAVKREWMLMGMFLMFSFLIFVMFPFMIRRSVKRKMTDKKWLGDPVIYEFMDDGILTTTVDDSGMASWKTFTRAISRKQFILLYDAKKQAVILPVNQLGEQYTEVVDMIFEHMPAPAVRIRRLDGKNETGSKKGKE